MSTWEQFAAEAPELAPEVRRVFEANQSHVLATLRRDGSPRVSGIEVAWQDGDLTFGSMPMAMKALDLRRDPRFALHSQPAEGGDAKIAGRVVETAGPPEQENHTFRFDLEQVTYTAVEGGDHLLIQTWHPGQDVARVQRY